MYNLFLTWKYISRALMFVSKFLFILLSCYYIFNFKVFSITFNVPQALRAFSIVDTPLKFLEGIGMMFLIIPLTIVIISFFHSEARWLQILSNLLSVGGNIFSVAHLASKGLLEEYFRTFIVTIYNAPSLDLKTKIFSDIFNQRINIYNSSIKDISDFQQFVQSQINDNFITYQKTLKTLSQVDIITFASKIADQIYNSYLIKIKPLSVDTLNTISSTSDSLSGKMFTIGSVLLLTLCVLWLGYKTYQNSILLRDVGSEMVNLGKRATNAIRRITGVDTAVDTVNSNLKNTVSQLPYLPTPKKLTAEEIAVIKELTRVRESWKPLNEFTSIKRSEVRNFIKPDDWLDHIINKIENYNCRTVNELISITQHEISMYRNKLLWLPQQNIDLIDNAHPYNIMLNMIFNNIRNKVNNEPIVDLLQIIGTTILLEGLINIDHSFRYYIETSKFEELEYIFLKDKGLNLRIYLYMILEVSTSKENIELNDILLNKKICDELISIKNPIPLNVLLSMTESYIEPDISEEQLAKWDSMIEEIIKKQKYQ